VQHQTLCCRRHAGKCHLGSEVVQGRTGSGQRPKRNQLAMGPRPPKGSKMKGIRIVLL
jgi:hypothetical protein